MAIRVSKPTYARWPVKFKLTEPDGSVHEEEAVIHYALGPIDTAKCGESITGWEPGVFVDDDGAPLEHSPEAVARLFNNAEIATGLLEGFYAIVRGEHLLKNSPTSSTG